MLAPDQYDEFNIGDTFFKENIQTDNYVKTTRYTILSFVPMTILENFQRLANIYFLVVALLCFIPWSPVTPIVSVVPLVFVISVSMLKAFVEDLFRYQSDKKYNSVRFEVYRNGRFRKMASSSIRPGDILRIPSNIENPADILVITSSEPREICFINEVNLNGETALKQRKSIPKFSGFSVSNDIATLQGSHIKIPWPTNDLRSLDGTIFYQNEEHSFSMKNCALRGTYISHTGWVIGIALYTGHDTRIIQNQRHPPHKTSHLESQLNKIVGIDFFVNFLIIILCSIMGTKSETLITFHWVEKRERSVNLFLEFFTAYMIIFSYMIPISLYVTVEFVRFFQRWIFSSDLGMFSPGLGFCQPNNSNLNEELGQIDHIFSDKTGTLTENIMKFAQLSARGTIYDVISDKERVKSTALSNQELREILVGIAVCHTVILSAEGFSSESPDEEALVTYARELNASLVARIPDESITISIGDKSIKFDHLATVEFDSDRKRMSVVLRDPNGQMFLFTKGADTIMVPLLSKDEEQTIIRTTMEQVDAFAEQGLRTLLYAWRQISQEEWDSWYPQYRNAGLSMENRDKKVKEVGGLLEKDLFLLGSVAIEDQLQPNVPETMSYLSQMGIKLWVLTGDKHETAVSIAKSTNVITPECKVIELLTNNPSDVDRALELLRSAPVSVLVVSPASLIFITENRPEVLVECGKLCRSVICFRMSPFLKSKVVQVMRENTKSVCLAVGDGANDVNMIQTANVGVGIIGREGRQAAQNSDFAITRFKHLKRLLAVHGRLSLVRLSGVVRYMIYKNLVFCLPQLWFFCFTNWTPTSLFDGWLLATYNLLWTLFPPGEYGFFEQDISFLSMMKYPDIYREARSGKYINLWCFLKEGVNSVYQSLVLFYLNVYVPSQRSINSVGMTDCLSQSGVQLYIAIVLVVNMQTIIRSQHWNVFLFLGVVVSILIFFLINLPYGSFASLVPDMYFVPQTIFTTFQPYISLILSVIAALSPEAFIVYLKGMVAPSYTRCIRELELTERSQRRKGIRI